jgi:hypothetical protein
VCAVFQFCSFSSDCTVPLLSCRASCIVVSSALKKLEERNTKTQIKYQFSSIVNNNYCNTQNVTRLVIISACHANQHARQVSYRSFRRPQNGIRLGRDTFNFFRVRMPPVCDYGAAIFSCITRNAYFTDFECSTTPIRP